MGKKKASRSDYKKAREAGEKYFSDVYKPDRFWSSFQKLLGWLSNIPPAKTPLTKGRQLRHIHYQILEAVGRALAKDLETIGKREYPRRFRPVYTTIAEKLPLAIWKRLSMRQFAESLGISWRTIRDCIWYMRRIGFEIPYTVLPYR
jgi:hypothetical protein